MNQPQYMIYGAKRRELKKELGRLKRSVKNYWFYHQLDKDMTSFYGGRDDYPMSDEKAEKQLNITNNKIILIEEELLIPYN